MSVRDGKRQKERAAEDQREGERASRGGGGKAGWEKEEKEWEEAGSVLVSTDAIKYAERENR